MYIRIFPIFFINTDVIFEVYLIHSESYQQVFWLPLFLVRILVFHTHLFHNATAPGVVDVMRCRNIWKSISFHLRYHGLSSLCNNPLMPKFLPKPIPKIMAIVHVNLYIANGIVVLFQTDCVSIGLWLCIICRIPCLFTLPTRISD